MRSFISDNVSGASPEILDAVISANQDHAMPYGADPWTLEATEVIQSTFGTKSDPYFVYAGTAANVLALASVIDSYQSTICSSVSHLNLDECGSPETFTGSKLIPVESVDGKLTPELILRNLDGVVGDEHRSQPRVISITQANEYGLVYTPEEVRALSKVAKENKLLLHMDGARLSNGAVSLGLDLKEASVDLGVDILSFGGTKNGLIGGEVVIFFDEALSERAKFYRKKLGQLASKMRFISAQFIPYLKDQLWQRNASQANKMAIKLGERLGELPSVEITREVETNMVYFKADQTVVDRLSQSFETYFIEGSARLVTSFDTTEQDIEDFINIAKGQ